MRVLNFGSLNIDYVYKVDHILAKGETLLSDDRQVFSGGKGLNQSVAMGRAGLAVSHAGNIGLGGEFLLEELASAGVDTTNVRILTDIPSGHTVIQNSADGDNCILLFGGANQCVTREQVDQVIDQFESGDVIVLQNEVNELAYIMEKAHEKGMIIVLNPSPMNKNIASLPLEYVDIFFVNEIEAGQIIKLYAKDTKEIAADTAADSLMASLRTFFPKAQLVLTLGSEGSMYAYEDTLLRQPCIPVKAIDTTAAGDTFTGYFSSGILMGMDAKEAMALAAKASAITVSRPGASPSIPTREEVISTR